MKKFVLAFLTASTALTLAACGGESASEGTGGGTDGDQTVTVYSSHQNEIINPIVKEFQDETGIKVDVVNGGTGEILNRITAEASNPGGDVIWGGGAESLEAYADNFEAYTPEGADAIADDFKSADGKWTGFSALPMVIMYNKDMVDEADAPQSWEDLLDDKWTGKIAFTDPSKSGSAYTQIVTMLYAFEEGGEKGWDFVESFVDNLDGTILSSSSMVPKGVADGEFPVGITLEEAAFRYVDGGSNVGIVYPEEGTSAVPDGIALIKDAKNTDAAQQFIDYVVSKTVQEKSVEDFNRRSIRNDVEPPAGLMPSDEIPLVDYGFQWSSDNKEDVMKRFQQIIIEQQ